MSWHTGANDLSDSSKVRPVGEMADVTYWSALNAREEQVSEMLSLCVDIPNIAPKRQEALADS
jgi:hypothetical protein